MTHRRVRAAAGLALAAVLGLLGSVAPAALADELELTNGTIYKGKVVSQDSSGVTFEVQMDDGGSATMTLPESMIRQVRRGEILPPTVENARWKTGQADAKTRDQVEKLIADASNRRPSSAAWPRAAGVH